MTKKSMMSCSEKIISAIKDAIQDEIVQQIQDCEELRNPDLLNKNLIECNDLCHRLLEYDYFKESEELLDDAIKSYEKDIKKETDKWLKLYNREIKVKKKDLKRLFDLIVEDSEDWC